MAWRAEVERDVGLVRARRKSSGLGRVLNRPAATSSPVEASSSGGGVDDVNAGGRSDSESSSSEMVASVSLSGGVRALLLTWEIVLDDEADR